MRRYLLITLILIGCGKDPILYIELNISDSFLSKDYVGIAILSDNEGVVVDHQRFGNNEQVQLSIQVFEKPYHLTLIKLGNQMRQSHYLTTFKNVPAGHFYIDPLKPNLKQTKQINIDNQNSIFSIASTSAGIQELEFGINTIEAGVNDEFLILSTNVFGICDFGPCFDRYGFLPISNEDPLIIEGLQSITLDTIYPESNILRFSGAVNGLVGSNSNICDYSYYEIPSRSYYNTNFFLNWSDYFDALEIEYRYDSFNNVYLISQLMDRVPEQISPIEANYEITNQEPEQFKFDFDTPYTYYKSSFNYSDPDLKNIFWRIIDGNQDAFKLPDLKEIPNSTYINDKKNELEFEKLDIYTYSSLNNYDDFLFNTYYSTPCNFISRKYNKTGDYIIQTTVR